MLCADLVVCHRPIFENKVKLPSEIKPPFKANSERPLPEAPLEGGLRGIYLNFNFWIQSRELNREFITFNTPQDPLLLRVFSDKSYLQLLSLSKGSDIIDQGMVST